MLFSYRILSRYVVLKVLPSPPTSLPAGAADGQRDKNRAADFFSCLSMPSSFLASHKKRDVVKQRPFSERENLSFSRSRHVLFLNLLQRLRGLTERGVSTTEPGLRDTRPTRPWSLWEGSSMRVRHHHSKLGSDIGWIASNTP